MWSMGDDVRGVRDGAIFRSESENALFAVSFTISSRFLHEDYLSHEPLQVFILFGSIYKLISMDSDSRGDFETKISAHHHKDPCSPRAWHQLQPQ
jgi:hypothetical protein